MRIQDVDPAWAYVLGAVMTVIAFLLGRFSGWRSIRKAKKGE